MGRFWDGGSYSQPTAEELQHRSETSRKKAEAAGAVLQPVVISGRRIAKSWWGMAWCKNLERYADYESRLDRGKRYLRTGAVIDLQIQAGRILAKVQGSRKTPYAVEVCIDQLPEGQCQAVLKKCGRRVETLEALLTGSFPEELKELFQARGGLFLSPKEIHFSCSCPDWAQMCKHVSAVLYGVGARLDTDPALFFELRGIEIGRFVDTALANKVEAMLANAQKPSARILEDADLNALFGVL